MLFVHCPCFSLLDHLLSTITLRSFQTLLKSFCYLLSTVDSTSFKLLLVTVIDYLSLTPLFPKSCASRMLINFLREGKVSLLVPAESLYRDALLREHKHNSKCTVRQMPPGTVTKKIEDTFLCWLGAMEQSRMQLVSGKPLNTRCVQLSACVLIQTE